VEGRSGNRVEEFEWVVLYTIEIGRRELKGESVSQILLHYFFTLVYLSPGFFSVSLQPNKIIFFFISHFFSSIIVFIFY